MESERQLNEEQLMEIEALKAIYLDDFHETEDPFIFEISLVPQPGGENHGQYYINLLLFFKNV